MNSYMKETSSRSKQHRTKEATGESQLSNAPKNVKNGCVVAENGPFEVVDFPLKIISHPKLFQQELQDSISW